MFLRPRHTNKNGTGFTLIELMVVISIISLLSSIVLASINTARAKARDVVRLAHLKQLQTLIEIYRDSAGYVPETNRYGIPGSQAVHCTEGGWDTSFDDGIAPDPDCGPGFMQFLTSNSGGGAFSGNLTSQIPNDPINNASSYFRYYYYATELGYGCQPPFYVLQAIGTEAGLGTQDNTCYEQPSDPTTYTIVGQ